MYFIINIKKLSKDASVEIEVESIMNGDRKILTCTDVQMRNAMSSALHEFLNEWMLLVAEQSDFQIGKDDDVVHQRGQLSSMSRVYTVDVDWNGKAEKPQILRGSMSVDLEVVDSHFSKE